MLRLILAACFVMLCAGSAFAQFELTPKGPFTRWGFPVYFFVSRPPDSNVTVQNYRWVLYTSDGVTLKTIDTQEGPDASRYQYKPLNEGKVPTYPVPQLAVTLTLRNRFSPTPYEVTRVFPIEFQETIFSLTETDGKDWFITPFTRTVGRREKGTFGISNFPNYTTRATLMLIGSEGDTIEIVVLPGAPYIPVTERGKFIIFPLTFDINPWPGGVRVRAIVEYQGSPTGGYVQDLVIPDSVPRGVVTASKGFGPFRRGVDLPNTFTIKGLGPACTAVEATMHYATDDGQIRTFVRDTFSYNGSSDSVTVTYNMRNVSRGTTFTVRGIYGKVFPTSKYDYPLTIADAPPIHSINGTLPITPGTDKDYVVRIDSLPPRIVELQMILTSASGKVLDKKNVTATSGTFISSDSITFNAKALSFGTYVVRTRAVNDQRDDAPDFFFGFEVRDKSRLFLVADSWGSYTQGDSATITPGITDVDVRHIGLPGWSGRGKFMIIDSTKPDMPLYVSPEVEFKGVRSRDSIVYWPDSSYKYGAAITRRARIQTSDLPLSARVIFETEENYGEERLSHPIFMVPSPGILTSSPRLDSTLIATRKTPVVVRFSNITPDATGIRFRVNGTRNRSALAQSVVPVAKGQKEATFTFDAGLLPVNSILTVAPVTSLSDDIGAEIVRSINTRPDTLTMRAEPPIDTLLMEWDIETKTQLIRGVQRLDAKLTFSKLPAQTMEIHVLSFDDTGNVIDSMVYPVPYRLTYDSTLRVTGSFPFHTFNTTSLQVRYFTDGGPDGGIRYNKSIVTRFREPLWMRVRKMNYEDSPPSVDNSPLLQGSNNIAELAVRWRAYDLNSTVGYNSPCVVDSVRLEILDCAGEVLETMRIGPNAIGARSGSAADILYKITNLPLSTQRVQARLYSKSMTLPAAGVLVTAPLTLRTSPNLYVPLGLSYPTYRVNDTLSKKLEQKMAITNLNAVVSIDSLSIVDKSGKTAFMFESQSPRMDSIVLPGFDFNTLSPEKAPYQITGLVRTTTCGTARATRLELAKIEVQNTLSGESTNNWIYSSQGWGPFQQGRAPESQFVLNLDPSRFITNRTSMSDVLEIGLQPVSKQSVGELFKEVVTEYTYPAGLPVPNTSRARATFSLTSFDPTTSIQVRVRWMKKSLVGRSTESEAKYSFPISMLPFPDQPIDPDTTRYEQSVLAGSSGDSSMTSNYNFGMQPQSSDIDYLRFTMLSSAGVVLDTFSIQPSSRDTVRKTSIFKSKHDVAQYPWPHVAPDREKVTINIGYQFKGADKPTKVQKTSIEILPRAEWLNGSVAQLTRNGTATATSIPISVSIPMPASVYESTVPVFGRIEYFVEGEGSDKSTNLVVNASYNPATRGFTMQNSAPGGSFWVPTITLAGGVNYNKSSVTTDGLKSGEFTALYRFEAAPCAATDTLVANRELRVRSLTKSSFEGAVSMIHWIKETAETMERLIKSATLVASGGILQITPTFTIDASVQHLSTVNIGTEEKGALVHVGDEEPTSKTEQDEFPTSQSVAFTLRGGGGIEASMLGLIGIGASVTDDYMFASGSIFRGPIASTEYKYYPTRLNYSRWFNLELSLFFGIINIDLFKGRMFHLYDPRIMPSYLVFDESWESVFTTSKVSKPRDQVQIVEQISKLPEETPYYRPAPSIAANDSQLVTVHLEQSLLGRNGRLVLSTLDQTTHSLIPTAIIADNRNAMHNPTVELLGNDGSALISWVQNDVDAFTTPASLQYEDLLRTENIHAAWYDASTQRVIPLPRPAHVTDELIDGVPTIAVARDLRGAAVVWNALDPVSNTVENYIRKVVRTDSGWSLGATTRLQATNGINRSLSVTSMNDGTYVVTWINDNIVNKTSRLMSARIYANGTVDLQEVNVGANVDVSKARMEGNGDEAFLLFARSLKVDQREFERSIDIYRFVNGSWVQIKTLALESKRGVARHIDVDLRQNGSFVVLIDAIDHSVQSKSKHAVYAVTGSIDEPSDSWTLFRDHSTFPAVDRSIWSLCAAIGPKNIYYVATQELDSLRGNHQLHSNGLQLGPSRCNAVIRAARFNDKGLLEPVKFGNAVTSVDDEPNADLEMAMRYRIKVMDPAPNPVREACVVPLAVQRDCNIEVKLFDAVGSYISTIYTGPVTTGIQGVSFAVSELTSGHYTVVVTDQLGVAGSVPVVVVR